MKRNVMSKVTIEGRNDRRVLMLVENVNEDGKHSYKIIKKITTGRGKNKKTAVTEMDPNKNRDKILQCVTIYPDQQH